MTWKRERTTEQGLDQAVDFSSTSQECGLGLSKTQSSELALTNPSALFWEALRQAVCTFLRKARGQKGGDIHWRLWAPRTRRSSYHLRVPLLSAFQRKCQRCSESKNLSSVPESLGRWRWIFCADTSCCHLSSFGKASRASCSFQRSHFDGLQQCCREGRTRWHALLDHFWN